MRLKLLISLLVAQILTDSEAGCAMVSSSNELNNGPLKSMFITVPAENLTTLSEISKNTISKAEVNQEAGKKLNAFIVNGIEASLGQLPHQAGIIVDDSMFCGGSLIAPHVILTAGHCVYGFPFFKITLGSVNLPSLQADALNSSIVYKYSEKGILHPGYNSNTLVNDVAMIIISGVASQRIDNVRIGIVSLPSSADLDLTGKQCLVSGWGLDKSLSDGGQLLPVLNYLNLDIYNFRICGEFYGISNFTYNIICGGSSKNQSTCQGDSGGPLVCRFPTGLVQVGIVSFGGTSCTKGYPLGFTAVHKYLDWIKKIISSTAPAAKVQSQPITKVATISKHTKSRPSRKN